MAPPDIQLIIGFLAVGFTDQTIAAISTLKDTNQILKGQLLSGQYLHSNFCESALQQRNYSCSRTDSCPTWFICDHSESGKCQCGPNYNDGVKCNEKRMVSAVLNCYCVTEVNNKMYVGLCFYNCGRPVTI